jgi:branched-chain amino acid transport system ATP-binding protein
MSLVLERLSVAYGAVDAVRDISLTVAPGAVTTIIGANGAGKSTIMKAISGLLPQAQGRIRFEGADLLGMRANAIVSRGVALVPEGRRLFPSMTVRENLLVGAFHRRDRSEIARDLVGVLARLPVLADRLAAAARTLSGGQQQMLAIGRALMSRPRLLMLDEPTVGLSPQMVLRVGEIIRAVSTEGVDILLVEQNAQLALGVANYGYVLETGAITLHGPTSALRDNPAVQAAYLGIGDATGLQSTGDEHDD